MDGDGAGTVDAVVVLTDLVGSTPLARALGDGWPAVHDRHDDLTAQACTSRGGKLAGTTGDGSCYLFPDGDSAVTAADALMDAVALEPWPGDHVVQLRIGIHAGPVQVGRSGFGGVTIHETARITALAGTGRIVVSEAAHAAVSGVPAGARLVDLGTHTVRDFAGPVRLYGLVGGGRGHPGAILRQDERLEPLPMFGRDDDLAGLRAALARGRLVTLVGPGGIGKTRLSAELARTHPGDVLFADLARVDQGDQVVATLTDLVRGAGSTVEVDLAAAIGSRSLLLVLDNCEHVIDAARSVCTSLLTACPRLDVLATSRQTLDLEVEDPWYVDGLDEQAAVELFVARASVAIGRGRAAELDRRLVAQVVGGVDHVPLAIELAAARLRVLELTDLVERMGDQMRLLVDPRHPGPQRQQTMTATIASSVAQLDPSTRAAFVGLSLFRGGALLDALAAVVEPVDDFALLDVLEDLVARSLVVRNDTSYHRSRYRQLEPIRQFAADGLDDHLRAVHRDRHARWVQRHIRAEARELVVREGVATMLADEAANIADAIEHALERGDVADAMRVVGALGYFWFSTLPTEGLRLVDRVLGSCRGTEPPSCRASVLLAAGPLLAQQLRFEESRAALSEAVEILQGRRTGMLGWAIFQLGRTASLSGDADQARTLFAQAVEVFEEVGEQNGHVWARYWSAMSTTDRVERRRIVREIVEEARGAQLDHALASMLSDLALDAFESGDAATALGHLDVSIDVLERFGDPWQLCDVCITAASFCLTFDRPEVAGYLRRAAALIGQDPDQAHRRVFVGVSAEWVRRVADGTDAAQLASALDDRWQPLYPEFQEWIDRCRSAATGPVRDLSLDEAVRRAIALAAADAR